LDTYHGLPVLGANVKTVVELGRVETLQVWIPFYTGQKYADLQTLEKGGHAVAKELVKSLS
jgi:hypothetical protein